MQEQRQHHWPDADDDNDNDKNGDDDDDHLTYEERLRVDSHKMLMPIIHLPYKPYQYQYRLCNKSLHCDNNDNDTSHQHQRHSVRRVGRWGDQPITKHPKGPFWAFLESTPPYIGLIESSKCTEYENNVSQVYN